MVRSLVKDKSGSCAKKNRSKYLTPVVTLNFLKKKKYADRQGRKMSSNINSVEHLSI